MSGIVLDVDVKRELLGALADTATLAANVGLASLWARWPDARRERLLGELPTLMEDALAAAASEPRAVGA